MIRNSLPDPYCPIHTMLELIALGGGGGTLALSTSWPANNSARYQPVSFPVDCTLYSISFLAGNTTGNYDLGFYDADYTRLASKGSTAMSAAVQTLTFSPEIRVKASRIYYAALALSSTSGSFLRWGPTATADVGIFQGQEASALPLPSTMTPVAGTSSAIVPIFAFGVR